jgi:hypothetical protein
MNSNNELEIVNGAKIAYFEACVERDKALESYKWAVFRWEEAANNYKLAIQNYVSATFGVEKSED